MLFKFFLCEWHTIGLKTHIKAYEYNIIVFHVLSSYINGLCLNPNVDLLVLNGAGGEGGVLNALRQSLILLETLKIERIKNFRKRIIV